MIESQTELKTAFRSLRILEQSLQALRQQLQTANPGLLEVTATSYTQRIRSLQQEIAEYLYTHPADVSALLPDAGEANEREALTV